MSYCTLEQLTDRYSERSLVQLTDRGEEAEGEIDVTVVDRAIADTAALIDGYLKVRYRLPLASVPPLVTNLALIIAFYKLHAHTVEEKPRRDYEDALRQLREIAKGEILLDVAGAEPAASGSQGVRTNNPERPITPASMKGYI